MKHWLKYLVPTAIKWKLLSIWWADYKPWKLLGSRHSTGSSRANNPTGVMSPWYVMVSKA